MRHSGRGLAIAAAAGSGLILVFSGSLRGAFDLLRTPALEPQDAATAVSSFVGGSLSAADLTVTGPTVGTFETIYEVDGARVTATVDANSGRVVGVVFLDQIPTATALASNAALAVQVAQMFLSGHSIPIDTTSYSVKLVDHGGSNEYQVTWQAIVGGVHVPDTQTVGINPQTNQVFRFLDVRRPYKNPGTPKVDRSTAISTAEVASGLGSDVVADNAELWLLFDAAGQQYLAWQVELSAPAGDSAGTSEHEMVQVDGTTGSAQVVAHS